MKSKKGEVAAQLSQCLDEKDAELKTKNTIIEQLRANHQSLEQQYHAATDSVPRLEVHKTL